MDERLRRLINLGREHYQAREYDKAEKYLAQVVLEHRGFADVFNMLGVIYHDGGRFTLAEDCFEEALRINPSYIEAALNLVVTYNEMGRYAEAQKVYERATERARGAPKRLGEFARGKIANMHADVAEVYRAAGMYAEAAGEMEKALNLCPTFIDLRSRLGVIESERGRLKQAAAVFSRVKKEKPGYVPARLHLGFVLYRMGKRKAAVEEWRDVLRVDPKNDAAKLYLQMIGERG